MANPLWHVEIGETEKCGAARRRRVLGRRCGLYAGSDPGEIKDGKARVCGRSTDFEVALAHLPRPPRGGGLSGLAQPARLDGGEVWSGAVCGAAFDSHRREEFPPSPARLRRAEA